MADATERWYCQNCGDMFEETPQSKRVNGVCIDCANDLLEREEHRLPPTPMRGVHCSSCRSTYGVAIADLPLKECYVCGVKP